MLAVQTESDNLYLPEWEIASLTPVYPERVRAVLADGRVAHRPGPMPPGPWVPLEDSRVNPLLLGREENHWKDPAGYLYPFQVLETFELEEAELDEEVLGLQTHHGKCFWRTDSGLRECDLKPEQALKLYPQLCKIGRSQLINRRRVRRYGHRVGGGWLECDNGERLEFSTRLVHEVCRGLGVDGLYAIDRTHSATYRRLRDFPYDLTSADPERIRRECPTVQDFIWGLLWQMVLSNLNGASRGLDLGSLSELVIRAGLRVGYKLSGVDLHDALSQLVHGEGIFTFRQLGLAEKNTSYRVLGSTTLLVVHPKGAQESLERARKLGLSLLLSRPHDDRLALEHLADHWDSPIRLFFLGVNELRRRTILRILEHLEVDLAEPPVVLARLSQLQAKLKEKPLVVSDMTRVPFRRIPLQLNAHQLFLVDPEEIAAWSPTLFGRWRVVLAKGHVMHHPGPVPPGPWVSWEGHWVQPQLILQGKDPAGFFLSDQPLPAAVFPEPMEKMRAGPALPCSPEEVLYLDDGWHLVDGRKIPCELPPELAAAHHPGLVRLNRRTWVHHNRIRSTRESRIQLDGGAELAVCPSRHTRQLKELLGGMGLNRLGPDHHGLQRLGIRDFPFEIASASATRLALHFNSAHHLICNLLYQSYAMHLRDGVFPYGNTFGGYFYRPLQAVLYRAGYLRGQHSEVAVKDRFYLLFTRTLTTLVYDHRLFSYRQFGFKDHFPEDRMIRTKRILLAEKGGRLEAFGRELQAEFDLSLVILKGMPSLLATEYLAEELKGCGIERVEVFFYGDFDYAGWDIGPAFVKQLKFYGVGCDRLERLVLPEVFSPEELALHSSAPEAATATIEGRIRLWLMESGGINGQPLGIHANWFAPYERVRARLAELLG